MKKQIFENIGGNKFKLSFNEAESDGTLKANERKAINNEITKHKELDGNVKVDSLGKALTVLTNALDKVGYNLDMVTGDILLGDKGTRMLTFRRKSTSPDPFIEGTEIENSRISFNWEVTSTDDSGIKRYEVVAYAS
jgi:hypothetical protein